MLTWYLYVGYELQIKFTFRSGPMILAELCALDFEIWLNI